jgi:hypothetical protein
VRSESWTKAIAKLEGFAVEVLSNAADIVHEVEVISRKHVIKPQLGDVVMHAGKVHVNVQRVECTARQRKSASRNLVDRGQVIFAESVGGLDCHRLFPSRSPAPYALAMPSI